MKIKKYAFLMLGIFLTVNVFSRCGLKSISKNENITLTFWSGYKNEEAKVFEEKIIPAFNKIHPNVKIEPKTIDATDYDKELIKSIVEGKNPDIARIDIISVSRYAKLGAIAPVDDAKGFEEIKSQLYEKPMSTAFYDGRYYGIPINTNTKVGLYNKNILKEAGMTEAPKTFDELIALQSKLQDSDIYPLSIEKFEVWGWAPYFLSFGGEFANEDNTKATGFLNSEESVRAIKKIVELTNNKIMGQPALGDVATWDGLIDNKYIMIDEGPWWFTSNKELKDQVICAELPSENGKSISVIGGEDTVIFNNCENKEMANEFIQFLASDEAQTIFCEELGMLPVNKNTATKDCVTNNELLNIYSSQLETAWARIPNPNWSAIDNILQRTFEKCLSGSDIKLELDKAAEQLDTLLEND